MDKDFDQWNVYKKKLHASNKNILYKSGEVWWCALGLNIGHEQDGGRESFERPVLIITTFSNGTCLCIPMTTSKNNSPYCKAVQLLGRNIYVIVSQSRTLSINRFLRKLGSLSNNDFRLITGMLHKTISGQMK